MAIDREAITDAIFEGTRVPANSVIAPVVDGNREDAASTARSTSRPPTLLDEAGFDVHQPVDLWFNAGGHDAWVEAVGNQLQENLGIEFTLQGNLDFAEYLPLLDEEGHRAVPSRLEHGLPEPQNSSRCTPGGPAAGGLELGVLREPGVRRARRPGQRGSTNEEAIKLLQQAEDLLLEDMPVMPMFFGLEQTVWSENVDNVKVDIFGRVDVASVTVK